MRRLTARAALAVGVSFLLLFTSLMSSRSFAADNEASCNPIGLHTCTLPFPSNFYSVQDNASPTGIRLHIPEAAIRADLLKDVPKSINIQKIANSSSGFSAASAVLFEVDQQPDEKTLPESGGETVYAFDLDTGASIPLRAQVNRYARSKKVSSPSHIVEIFPRSRWQYGSRVVVALTRSLKPKAGGEFTPTTGFQQVLNDDDSALHQEYSAAIDLLESKGIAKSSLLSATYFTVRTENEVTGPMRHVIQQTLAADHPIRNVKTYYQALGPIAAYVKGEVRVLDYRNADGLVDYTLTPREDWLRFRLSLPRHAAATGAPIMIYGHGLSVFKETDVTVAQTNAHRGVATLSIDQPNHGTRIRKDGGYVFSLLSTENVGRLLGMVSQSPIDFMSLYQAARTSFGNIDALPHSKRRGNGDGIPDLNTQRIYYGGTSLGGVLGLTFVSLAPELKGSFTHVTGVGITSILSTSVLWTSVFSNLEPREANGAEALLLRAAIQHELDYGDAINFVQYIRNPPPGILPKPAAMVIGMGDTIVPNPSSQALAEIAQLPLAGNALFEMPDVTRTDDFVDGYGVKQFRSLTHLYAPIDNLVAHVSFLRRSMSRELGLWLDQREAQP